jgi:hypothetical protein
MALAMIYPEPEKGGRGKKAAVGNLLETSGFSRQLLDQARTVLRHSRETAYKVLAGTEPLDTAYQAAVRARQDDLGEAAKLARLRKYAPDVAAMIYPEPNKGGRASPLETKGVSQGFLSHARTVLRHSRDAAVTSLLESKSVSAGLLSQARTVLRHSRETANKVLAGTEALDVAYQAAVKARQDDQGDAAKPAQRRRSQAARLTVQRLASLLTISGLLATKFSARIGHPAPASVMAIAARQTD